MIKSHWGEITGSNSDWDVLIMIKIIWINAYRIKLKRGESSLTDLAIRPQRFFKIVEFFGSVGVYYDFNLGKQN